jgi:hypothetical protein
MENENTGLICSIMRTQMRREISYEILLKKDHFQDIKVKG